MKLLKLRKKIITNLVVSGFLLVIFGSTIYYNVLQKKSAQDQAAVVQSEISTINDKYAELENKAAEIKKYQEAWKNISSSKKVIGNIKMDDINAKLNLVADKYSIIKPAIKVILPEDISSGIFNRSTVTIALSTANLTFEAINDVKALSFISEFINSIQGYAVITNLELRKSKKYTEQDLVAISSGKGQGAISAKVDFYWYIYKPKAAAAPQVDQSKSIENQPK